MSWLVTAKQYIPAVIGEPFGGGYFAGYISHTADGNPTHALIVAPRATGATGTGYTLTTNLAWKTTATSTANTGSSFDGVANTTAVVTAGIADHPAAEFCVNLNVGGFTDWYLPSRYEQSIAYFNLRPNTIFSNHLPSGVNPYSVPRRDLGYTALYPGVTQVSLFITGGSEAFVDNLHVTSTEFNAGNHYYLNFANGLDTNAIGKVSTGRVRAFRRIAL